MKLIPGPRVNDTPYDRIDAMQISVFDRELSKSRFRTGEHVARAVCTGSAALRSCAVSVARHVRAAIAPLPQH